MPFLSRAPLVPAAALAALLAAGGADAALFTYDDEAAFLAATGATSVGAVPDTGTAGTTPTLGTLGFSTGPGALGFIFGANGFAWSSWSTLIPGNAFVLSGVESFNIDLAGAMTSFGMQVHQPSAGGTPPDTTNAGPGIASVFAVTLKSGGTVVGGAQVTPPSDVLSYFGVWSHSPFDRVEIVETVGGIDNEYFGAFATGTTPAPIPLPGGLPLVAASLGALVAVSRRRAGG